MESSGLREGRNVDRRGFFAAVGAGLGIPLLETDVCLADEHSGAMEVIRDGNVIWFVDAYRVNLDDLMTPHRPGRIVRCDGNPNECVKVYRMPNYG
jgi:hypothetical protein